MNKHSSIKSSGSLLERANALYDFGSALRGPAPAPIVTPAPIAEPQPAVMPVIEDIAAPQVSTPIIAPLSPPIEAKIAAPHGMEKHIPRPAPHFAKIDKEYLLANNFIDPDGAVTALSEEFRIVKRQLLLAARGGKGVNAVENGERILICSAHPNEGKTFCSINLALSMASEKDNRVLLIDADFAKPSILRTLGIENSKGFMDALADPSVDAEDFIIETDVPGLSILPAGAQTNQDTEYLAAARTAEILDQLTCNDPSRIIIFDSPPALAASPASVLALHVGQILMVVQADKTADSALRDALNLLSGCEHIQLILNRTKFSPTGRKFGSYYGYGA